MFKAEPVDQYGNLIDRHNLWEMVGVRFRRALFPGYSDTVEYAIDCTGGVALGQESDLARSGREVQEFDVPTSTPGHYEIVVSLMYRKVDQFLLNYMLGEDTEITAPIVEMVSTSARVAVRSSESEVPAAGR